MRESIGGAFLIKIMVVFLVLYNSLLAIAVNYAIAFRVKNHIIDLLEQYEGCNNISRLCASDITSGDCISTYVGSVGYYRTATPTDNRGYNIDPINTDRGTYYRVHTYIRFSFPIVNDIVRADITGETKVIYGIQETDAQCNGV